VIDIPATIAAIAAVITAVGVIVNAVLIFRTQRAAREAKETAVESKAELVVVGNQIRTLGKAVDGRLTKLLETTEAAMLAKGRDEGFASEKKRAGDEKQTLDTAVKKANGGKT
jgi:hypothetical protein